MCGKNRETLLRKNLVSKNLFFSPLPNGENDSRNYLRKFYEEDRLLRKYDELINTPGLNVDELLIKCQESLNSCINVPNFEYQHHYETLFKDDSEEIWNRYFLSLMVSSSIWIRNQTQCESHNLKQLYNYLPLGHYSNFNRNLTITIPSFVKEIFNISHRESHSQYSVNTQYPQLLASIIYLSNILFNRKRNKRLSCIENIKIIQNFAYSYKMDSNENLHDKLYSLEMLYIFERIFSIFTRLYIYTVCFTNTRIREPKICDCMESMCDCIPNYLNDLLLLVKGNKRLRALLDTAHRTSNVFERAIHTILALYLSASERNHIDEILKDELTMVSHIDTYYFPICRLFFCDYLLTHHNDKNKIINDIRNSYAFGKLSNNFDNFKPILDKDIKNKVNRIEQKQFPELFSCWDILDDTFEQVDLNVSSFTPWISAAYSEIDYDSVEFAWDIYGN